MRFENTPPPPSYDFFYDFGQIEMMKGFCHRNVAQLYSSFITKTHVVSVMEICQSDLYKCITNRRPDLFPLETIISWCCQIFCGLRYLHKINVIHRDIKPAVSSLFLKS